MTPSREDVDRIVIERLEIDTLKEKIDSAGVLYARRRDSYIWDGKKYILDMDIVIEPGDA